MKNLVDKLNMKKTFQNSKIYFFVKIVFSIIFAITIMLDNMLYFKGNIFGTLSEIHFLDIKISNILVFLITFILTYIFISLLELITDKLEKNIYKEKTTEKLNIKVFFIIFGVILIFWLPYILSYFPGGVFVDTIASIRQAIKIEELNNNNPILYALLLKPFLYIGINIKDLSLGIKIFSLVQTTVMAGAISYFIYILYKKQISTKYIILITAFFALFNLIPAYAISIWKDTPFCIALFLYIVSIMQIIYNNGKNIQKSSGIINYTIFSILVMFLRNNGIYVVFATTLIILLAFKKEIFKQLRIFTICSITTLIICLIIQGPVYKYYNWTNSFKENVGVLLQQISYVVVNNGNITEEQVEFINNLCPTDIIKKYYNPCVVDKIKNSKEFNVEFLTKNKKEFFKVWFQLFLQNPSSYIKAYLLNTIGFWDVNKSTKDGYISMEKWQTLDAIDPRVAHEQSDLIEKITNKSIRNILEPKATISSAIFLFITLIGMVITIYKKRYKNLVIYAPIILTYFTILIAVPLAFSLRYVYISVLSVPISLIIPFLKTKNEEKK